MIVTKGDIYRLNKISQIRLCYEKRGYRQIRVDRDFGRQKQCRGMQNSPLLCRREFEFRRFTIHCKVYLRAQFVHNLPCEHERCIINLSQRIRDRQSKGTGANAK